MFFFKKQQNKTTTKERKKVSPGRSGTRDRRVRAKHYPLHLATIGYAPINVKPAGAGHGVGI